jgi:hypothetical protein
MTECGCEACHGGLVRLAGQPPHGERQPRANVANGMRALENPKVRAGVCLDCHFGGRAQGQFVTHQIMAAGHPRVSFELDLFSSLQQHWDVDADYVKRKGYAAACAPGPSARRWRSTARSASIRNRAAGRAPSPSSTSSTATAATARSKTTPRPAHLGSQSGRPIPSGQPPFNDENMIMLSAAAKAVSPSLAARFDADSRAFHAALARDKGESVRAAGRLAPRPGALRRVRRPQLQPRRDPGDPRRRCSPARSPSATPTMPVRAGGDGRRHSLERAGQFGQADRGAVARVRPALTNAYAQVRDPNAYRPDAFRASMAQVAQAARSLK